MTIEPPFLERARRVGWLLLGCALAAAALARLGPPPARIPSIVAAVAFAIFGLLAIVNVALVRSLYRRLEEEERPPPA